MSRAGLDNEDMEFVQFHPTGTYIGSKAVGGREEGGGDGSFPVQ